MRCVVLSCTDVILRALARSISCKMRSFAFAQDDRKCHSEDESIEMTGVLISLEFAL